MPASAVSVPWCRKVNVSNNVSIGWSLYTTNSCLQRHLKGGGSGKGCAYFPERQGSQFLCHACRRLLWGEALSLMLKMLTSSEQWENAKDSKPAEGTAYLFTGSTVIFLGSQDGVLEIELALKWTALLEFLAKNFSSTIISQILGGLSLQSILWVALEGGSLYGSSFYQAFAVLGTAHRILTCLNIITPILGRLLSLFYSWENRGTKRLIISRSLSQ